MSKTAVDTSVCVSPHHYLVQIDTSHEWLCFLQGRSALKITIGALCTALMPRNNQVLGLVETRVLVRRQKKTKNH